MARLAPSETPAGLRLHFCQATTEVMQSDTSQGVGLATARGYILMHMQRTKSGPHS